MPIPTVADFTPRSSAESVLQVQPWTPALWSLRVQKPAGFSFRPGHYARLGFEEGQTPPVWRAYSIVSAPQDAALEFLISLIPGGAFCSRLATLQPGDRLRIDARAMGFFVADQLMPGGSLWMLATGSGLGPYISLLREQHILSAWQDLVVIHSVRHRAELAYADELNQLAAAGGGQLRYIPIVTRETATPLQGRIPQLLAGGRLEQQVGLQLDPGTARIMVCGNPDFTADMRRLLNARGFQPCRRGQPGTMLFENYW